MGNGDPAAALASTGPRGRHTGGVLEERFFVVGLIWLALTIGLILYVIFGRPLCSPVQVKTFSAVVSIGVGFLAWTFAGNINVKTRKPSMGTAIVATGGFAVFVIMLLTFDGSDPKYHDPRCVGSNERDAVANYFNEVAVQTSNVITRVTEAKYNPKLNAQVFDDALTLKTKIDNFPMARLDELEQAILAEYGAQAYTALGMTLDVVARNADDGRTYARRALDYAEQAGRRLAKVMARTDDDGRAATEHVAKYKTNEKASYLAGLAMIMDAQWAELAGAPPAHSQDEINAAFESVSRTFFSEISAATDGPIKWFCSTHGKEVVPCGKL